MISPSLPIRVHPRHPWFVFLGLRLPVADVFRRRRGALPVRAAFLDDAVDDFLQMRFSLGGWQRHDLVGVRQHEQRAGLDALLLASLACAIGLVAAVLALLELSLAGALLAVLGGSWTVGLLRRAIGWVIVAGAVGLIGIVGAGF